MVPAEPAEPEKKIKETGEKVIHGFRIFKSNEDKICLQLGLKPGGEQTQKLLSSFLAFLKREFSLEVEVGISEEWKCPCSEINEHRQEIDEVILLLYFEKYSSAKKVDEYFINELFSIIHRKMRGVKNYEVTVPKGKSYLTWLERDILRFFWRFVPLRILNSIAKRISLKQRKPLKLRFHDLHNLKSVCSTAEWHLLQGEAFAETINEVQEMKSHLVKYEAFDYDNIIAKSSNLALQKFGKPGLAVLYERLRERNALKDELIKKKSKSLAVPLDEILLNLRKKNSYAGVHLLPVILSVRPGELQALKKITCFVNNELRGNDQRFGTIEDYLKWCQEHPTSRGDSLREVDSLLTEEDFPSL